MSASQLGSRLVIGAGATGRTHQLRAWLTETGTDTTPVTASPLSFVTADEVKSALGESPDLLVIDDLQWLEPDALRLVADAAKTTTVFASRRPLAGVEPDADLLDLVVELLTRDQPADRRGLLDLDDFVPALAGIRTAAEERAGTAGGGALQTDEVERLHLATGGAVGFASDAVAAGWTGEREDLPPALVDAVNARIRRAGSAAAQLARLWAVAADSAIDFDGDPLTVALQALPDDIDPSVAERAARAGGLVDEAGGMLPLVGWCAVADLTGAERGHLHDRVAAGLADTDRRAAAAHLLVGSGEIEGAAQIVASAALALAVSDPAEAPRYIDRAEHLGLGATDSSLLRALAAFHAGAPDAIAHLDRAQSVSSGDGDDRAALIGFGIDVRDLRFDSAASRPIVGDLAEPLRRLADGLAGRVDQAGSTGKTTGHGADTPLGAVVAAVASGIANTAAGNLTTAIGEFSTAADDYDRLTPTAPFGVTPHTVGALAALHVGDLAVVEILTEQAIDERSGGTGEALTHRLIRAYGHLVAGDFGEALAILRLHGTVETHDGDQNDADSNDGESPDDLHDLTDATPTDDDSPTGIPSQRDRLLLASLEAAIARRSGDTSRLRSAWRRAEEALIRPSASWLLTDPMGELLAAGARIGDTRRVEPIVESLAAQGLALPSDGSGPASAHWLRLQVAIASEDRALVTETAEAMAALDTSDVRSLARIEAAGAWSAIAGVEGARNPLTEEEVVGIGERLTEIGDRWEASRVLGQAALDEKDPKAARRLLELARVAATDQVDDAAGDGLSALGLSERESEVALLVVEGRTHKEVGAQLFISPKTVEHHVAKIRQKVGASSRAELLSIIREAVGG